MSKNVLTKILITGLAVVCVVVGFGLGVLVKEWAKQDSKDVSDSPYNALFNVSPTGETGFWIYSVRGGCPDLRAKDRKPLVVVVSASNSDDGRIGLSGLAACTELRLEGAGGPQTVSCAAGFIQLNKTSNGKDKSGSYSITLSDGTQRSGDFLGTYCEPETAGSSR